MTKLSPIFARYNQFVINTPKDDREILFYSGGETYISNRGDKRLHLFPEGTHDKYGAWITKKYVVANWNAEDSIFYSEVDLDLLEIGHASLTLPQGPLSVGVINLLCEYSIMAICGDSEALFCYFNPALMEYVRKRHYPDVQSMRERLVFSYFTGVLADPIDEHPDYFALLAFHSTPENYFKSLNVFPHVRKNFNKHVVEEMGPFVAGGEYMFALPLMESFYETLGHNFAAGLREFSRYSATCVAELSKTVVGVVTSVALAVTSLAVSLFVNGVTETYDIAHDRWGARIRTSYRSFMKKVQSVDFHKWAGSIYEKFCCFVFWE